MELRASRITVTTAACFSLLVATTFVAACVPTGNGDADGQAETASVKKEAGKTVYVDTHDAYAHTGKIDPASSVTLTAWMESPPSR
jgi:hypothetical protein